MTPSEQKLHDLERHRQEAETHHFRAKRSERHMHEFGDDPELATLHKEEMASHLAKRDASLQAASRIPSRDIDEAAQAVIDER